MLGYLRSSAQLGQYRNLAQGRGDEQVRNYLYPVGGQLARMTIFRRRVILSHANFSRSSAISGDLSLFPHTLVVAMTYAQNNHFRLIVPHISLQPFPW